MTFDRDGVIAHKILRSLDLPCSSGVNRTPIGGQAPMPVSQLSLIQDLRRQNIHPLPVDPEGDKVLRIGCPNVTY